MLRPRQFLALSPGAGDLLGEYLGAASLTQLGVL
jgi:hypothetical protein